MTPITDFPVLLVERVVDGDTLTLIHETDGELLRRQLVRLAIVDTPERNEPRWSEAGALSRQWLTEHAAALRVTKHLTAAGNPLMTFNRRVCDVYDAATGESLSSYLLSREPAWLWKG